jgi:hypothetical protein
MIPERLSADRFAAALATRLNSVAPPGLSVNARGLVVGVCDPHWWGGSAIADIVAIEDGRPIAERVATAARAILNGIQDAVMETTKEQWPVGSTGVGSPDVRVVGDELHMWFGDASKPILRLEALDLTEMVLGAA